MKQERLFRAVTAKIESLRNASENPKPLFISGPPKVGKTYEALFEAKTGPYKRHLYLDFSSAPHAKEAFEGDLSGEAIISKMESGRLGPESASFASGLAGRGLFLLILDNIDLCPKAITALKYLSEVPSLRVIAISRRKMSLIKGIPSIPTGYVDSIEIGPLSFEEFLIAEGYHSFDLFKGKYSFLENTPPLYLIEELASYLDSYLKIGGLPEAVLAFKKRGMAVFSNDELDAIFNSTTHSFSEDERKTSALLTILRAGISSLGLRNPKIKINGAPFQKDWTRYELQKAWELGVDTSVLRAIPRLNDFDIPGIPRINHSSNKSLIYDAGLAWHLLDDHSEPSIAPLYENLAFLLMDSEGLPTAYPANSGHQSADFILPLANGGLLPIDIKIGSSFRSRGLYQLLERENIPFGIIAAKKALSVTRRDRTIVVPLLYLSFLKEIIEKNGIEGKNP